MAVLDTTESLDTDFLQAPLPVPQGADIIQFPIAINHELVTGDYEGNPVYGLGKSAMESGHWMGVVRMAGFHLIFTDVQKEHANFEEAIRRQVALVEGLLYTANPGFTRTLDNDIEQTKTMIGDGFLVPGLAVVDYIHVSCMDRQSKRRIVHHPDSLNEHIDPQVRAHTLNVVNRIVSIL